MKEHTHVNRLIAVLVLLLFQICQGTAGAEPHGAHPPAKQKTVVTFVYFPLAVPVAVLGETLKRDRVLQQALQREGYGIEFKTLAKGPDALPLIRQRQIGAILFSDMPSIEASSTAHMLIAGTVKRSYASVVARHGALLERLRRKKVGNVFGSTSHYALLQALDSVQLAEQDVNIVPMELTEMPDALAAGRIDAFAAWEPTPTAALKKYPGQFSVIHRQVSLSFFLVCGELVAAKPAVADAIAAALVRSIRWMKRGGNLETASSWALKGMQDFSGKPSALSVRDIADITRSDLLEVPGAPLITAADKDAASALGREFDFLKGIGKIPPQSSRERFLDSIRPDLMQRVLRKQAHYRINSFDYAP